MNIFKKIRNHFKSLPVQVYIFDENSERKISKWSELPKHIKIESQNPNNIVKLHKNLIARNIKIAFVEDAYNSECILDDSTGSVGLDVEIIFLSGDGSKCSIGKGTGMNGTKIWMGNGSVCKIGDACRFSYEIAIRTTDGHTILDLETKNIVNHQKCECVIGDHSWVGMRSIIAKNVQLAHDTIVGAGSIVTKQFKEPYCVIAGNPAKVISTGVVHDKRTIYRYELENNLIKED